MVSTSGFYHALKVNPEKCYGCTICIFKCPTSAIRIRHGKATIQENWCIDCGECFMSCPSKAIYVEEDDFNQIYHYTYRVALLPALFISQFSKHLALNELNAALFTLGFTHIYPVELAVPTIKQAIDSELTKTKERPLISSFCPATTRLIQIKYPDLASQIVSIKSPVNGAALLVQEELLHKGALPNEIGIFYVTPCAAKIAEIKGAHYNESLINGVINMDTLYNKVNHILANRLATTKGGDLPQVPRLTACEMCWSLTSGEASHFPGRTLAIDEIHNVIEFIERMETTNDIQNVDFLELRACDGGCVGGALTPANRFIALERLKKRAESCPENNTTRKHPTQEAQQRLQREIHTKPVEPKAKLDYLGDINDVLKKMEQVRDMMCYLPGIDCGACGSPGCKELAEDIVRGEATLSSCLFLQRDLEHKGKMAGERAYQLIQKVWGKNRLDKNCYKRGAKLEGKKPG